MNDDSSDDEFCGDSSQSLTSKEAGFSKPPLFDEDDEQDEKLSCDVNEKLIDNDYQEDIGDMLIFDEYKADEETPVVNNEQIAILDGVDAAYGTLEGANLTHDSLKGADMIDCARDKKKDFHMLVTCYSDPFWEGIRRRDLLHIKLLTHLDHISASFKPSHDRSPYIQARRKDKKWMWKGKQKGKR